MRDNVIRRASSRERAGALCVTCEHFRPQFAVPDHLGLCSHPDVVSGIGSRVTGENPFASIARSTISSGCGPGGRLWEPRASRPPRRSLRRWLADLLWT